MRRGQHRVVRMTRPAYLVLAALLLADGAYVSARELARDLHDRPVSTGSIRGRIRDMRRLGVDTIQTDRSRPGRGRHSRGYRLVDLPPDEHLDGMLALVPAVKRTAWWADWTSVRMDCAS